MATAWEEVKRLAADFQRAQLSSTVQRLSERNCIEIVKKLIELKLIDVIFTSDGKEYLTPQRLLKEIKDELFVHGGRINLVELSQIIGVDFSHVEAKANEYARSEADVRIILGQLITNDYLDHLCEEINEKLQQTGQITIGELTKAHDLPGDFLQEVVYERLGSIIKANPDSNDPRTLFTETYVMQHKSRICGILSAVTRPVQVSNLINHFQIPERLFYSVAEELIKSGRICGSLSSGRSDKALYIPDIYSKSQNEWIDSFYKQNGYLEYDALSRLGIPDPKSHIQKRYKDEQLTYLSSCCVGKSILNLVESAIEDALSTGTLVDIMPILPSVFSTEDCQQIIRSVTKAIPKYGKVIRVYCDSIVVSDDVIQTCVNSFDALMNSRAQEDITKNPQMFMPQQSAAKTSASKREENVAKGKQEKKEERKKKGVSKSGGGTQGRETKIRAVKKKYLAGKGDESASDEECSSSAAKEGKSGELEFLGVDAIRDHLQKNIPGFEEYPEELVSELAEELVRPLNRKYEEVAKNMYESMLSNLGSSRKKQYAEFQEKLNSLLSHITVFEKSTKLFPEDVTVQLCKHLLKTLCTDVVNMIVTYLAQEHGVSSSDPGADITAEMRQKLIDKLPDEFRQPLKKLSASLHSKTLDEFNQTVEAVLSVGVCDLLSRKMDKKKERLLISNHRQTLLSQLSDATDPALCLHLAVLVMFQAQTHNALHASGKFVPHIISFLQKHLPLDVYQELALYQEYVIKGLTSEEDEERERTKTFLTEMMPKIKETALTFRKTSVSESEAH